MSMDMCIFVSLTCTILISKWIIFFSTFYMYFTFREFNKLLTIETLVALTSLPQDPPNHILPNEFSNRLKGIKSSKHNGGTNVPRLST